MMTVLPNKHCNTRPPNKTATKEHMKRDLEKELRQEVSDTAKGKWRRQHKSELDGDKSFVAYTLHWE